MLPQLLLVTVLVYLLGGFLGYWVHWLFHQPWSGPLYRLHKVHHEIMYPSGDFLSETYRDAGSSNTTPWFAALLTAVMLPFLLALWAAGVPPVFILIMAAESSLVGYLNNRVHDSLHIRGHFLERFRAFRKWRTAHRVHHANVKYNLGIFSYEWDRVFGSWKKPHIR